jgi:hypothetical protein
MEDVKMADYIPETDAEFDTWFNNFMTVLDKKKAALGLAASDMTSLTAELSGWNADYPAFVTARSAQAAATQTKNQRRTSSKAMVRKFVRTLQNNPNVTDADRAELDITIPDSTHTRSAVPTTRPVLIIDTSQSLQHGLDFFDEMTPNSRAKPEDVMGCEISHQIGVPEPLDPDEMRILAIDTATPYIATFKGEDAGKTVYYRLRWLNTRGERGPWSQLYSATITK